MHVNTEKEKNKKEVDMIFFALSLWTIQCMLTRIQKRNAHNKFLWLNRVANQHIIEHHDCLYMP